MSEITTINSKNSEFLKIQGKLYRLFMGYNVFKYINIISFSYKDNEIYDNHKTILI